MRIGDIIMLKMEKVLKKGMELDTQEYFCEVLSYDEEGQTILFGTLPQVIKDVSLDAVYRCMVSTEQFDISCTGLIKERYESEEGSIIKFYIENGFYKQIKEI